MDTITLDKFIQKFEGYYDDSHSDLVEHYKNYDTVMKQLLLTKEEPVLRNYVMETLSQTEVDRVRTCMSIISDTNGVPRDRIAQIVSNYMTTYDRVNLNPGLTVDRNMDLQIFFSNKDGVVSLVDKSAKNYLNDVNVWEIEGFSEAVKQVSQHIYSTLHLSASGFIEAILQKAPACFEAISAMAFHHTVAHCMVPALFITIALPLLCEGNFHFFLKEVKNYCLSLARRDFYSFYREDGPRLCPADTKRLNNAASYLSEVAMEKVPLQRVRFSEIALARDELSNKRFRNLTILGFGSGVVAGGIIAFSNNASPVAGSTLVMIGKGLAENIQITGRVTFDLVKGLNFQKAIATKAAEVAKSLLEFYKNGR